MLAAAVASLLVGRLAPLLPELKYPGFSAASAHIHQALLGAARSSLTEVPIVAVVGSSTGLYGVDERVVQECLEPLHTNVLNLCAGSSLCIANVRVIECAMQLRPKVVVWAYHPSMFTGSALSEESIRQRAQFARPYESPQRTLEVAPLYRWFDSLENRPRAVSSDLAVRHVHLLRYNGLLRRQLLAAGRAALGARDPWGRCSSPTLHSVYKPPPGSRKPAETPPLAFPAWEKRTDSALAAVAALRNEVGVQVLVVEIPTPQQTGPVQEEASRRIRDLCRCHGLPYVDLSETGEDDWFAEDAIHMNRKGKTEFSRLLAPYIGKALAE